MKVIRVSLFEAIASKTGLRIVGLLSLMMLGGCGSITGYSDAKAKFSCKAPDGVQCMSMSGVYANAMANNLPGQQIQHQTSAKTKKSKTTYTTEPMVMTKTISSGAPLRSLPSESRIW